MQTDERRWRPWTQPAAPVVDTVDVAEGQLQIGWVGGHRSSVRSGRLGQDSNHGCPRCLDGPAVGRRVRGRTVRSSPVRRRRGHPSRHVRGFPPRRCGRGDRVAHRTWHRHRPAALARHHAARLIARPDLRRQARPGGLQHRFHCRRGASAQRQRPVHPSAQRAGAGDVGQRGQGRRQRRGRWLVGARRAATGTPRDHRRAGPGRGRVPAVLDGSRCVHHERRWSCATASDDSSTCASRTS